MVFEHGATCGQSSKCIHLGSCLSDHHHLPQVIMDMLDDAGLAICCGSCIAFFHDSGSLYPEGPIQKVWFEYEIIARSTGSTPVKRQ